MEKETSNMYSDNKVKIIYENNVREYSELL